MMSKYQIQLDVEVPGELNASAADVRDWARFVTGMVGGMPANSPLVDLELEAVWGSVQVGRILPVGQGRRAIDITATQANAGMSRLPAPCDGCGSQEQGGTK